MSKQLHPSVLNVANEIGEFIQYWGFKKIHGRVWSLIFLAKEPVDANHLIENLHVSKALISMTLKDLMFYNVIAEAPKTGATVCYKPQMNIKDIIFDVLSQRESKMLLKIKAACEVLERSQQVSQSEEINPLRIQQMEEMIKSADSALKTLISLNDINLLPIFKKLNF